MPEPMTPDPKHAEPLTPESQFHIEVESEERRTVRTLRVVGPDGVGGSTSYEDEDAAQSEYDALVRGYRYGVASQRAALGTRVSELLDERIAHEQTCAKLAEAQKELTAAQATVDALIEAAKSFEASVCERDGSLHVLHALPLFRAAIALASRPSDTSEGGAK